MTVRELKEVLCEYDEDTLIFCNGVNTDCSVEKHGTVFVDSDDEDLYIHGEVLVLYTDAYC